MARHKRPHIPTAIYHVILKGNGGQKIFFSDRDRYRLYLLLQRGTEQFDHRIHAFCFMTNHVHLAIQVGKESLSKIIQNLALRYAKHINRTQKKYGHVFQGRFRSIVVDSNRYMKELIRYIHMNPVRAGIVHNPEEYRWSSHRAYLHREELPWLTRDPLLHMFGDIRKSAVTQYQQFTTQNIDIQSEDMFETGSHAGCLGDDQFVTNVRKNVGIFMKKSLELYQLVDIVCAHCNLTISVLTDTGSTRQQTHARAILAHLVKESTSISLVELAKFLHRDPGSLSRLAIRFEIRAKQDPSLATELSTIENLINQMSECRA